jgi:hypothetical protein
MKKLFTLTAVVAVAGAAQFASAQCCPAKAKAKQQAKVEAKAQGACDMAKEACAKACDWEACLKEMGVTAEQKAKLTALKGSCDKMACPVGSKQKWVEGMRKILTDKQIAKCQAKCKEQGVDSPFNLKAKAESDRKSVDG